MQTCGLATIAEDVRRMDERHRINRPTRAVGRTMAAPLCDSAAHVSVACCRQDRQLSGKREPCAADIRLPCDADVVISNSGK